MRACMHTVTYLYKNTEQPPQEDRLSMLSPDQNEALVQIKNGENVFLTGGAGMFVSCFFFDVIVVGLFL